MSVFRMARPARRQGSSFAYFRQRIPPDVLPVARGLRLDIPLGGAEAVSCRISGRATHVKVSLRTREPSEAKARNAIVLSHLADVYAALRHRAAPRTLTHKECVALAGDFYREWSATARAEELRQAFSFLFDEAGKPEDAAADLKGATEAVWRQLAEHDATGSAATLGKLIDRFVTNRGLVIDGNSRAALINEVRHALRDAFADQARNASGDYAPSTLASRFPPPLPAAFPSFASSTALTLTGLFELWRKAPERKEANALSTVRGYDRAFRFLAQFLAEQRGVTAASILCQSVTPSDVLAFAKHRLSEVSIVTVNDGDLASLKSVFGWAVEQERLLIVNPASGVRLKGGKSKKAAAKRRPNKGLTDEEAIAILRKATGHKRSGSERPKMAAAKRWVPWLMAYTGTRVGEMGQLRKEDVAQHDGHWTIRVTAEAGTQKAHSDWRIPLHPHLIEQGFLDYVRSAPDGHLFITPTPERYNPAAPATRTLDPRGILGPLTSLKNRLTEFARTVVTRADVDPNHGWRHRYKSKRHDYGIDRRVADAIQDHANSDEGDTYDNPSIAQMAAAIAKIPRYVIT